MASILKIKCYYSKWPRIQTGFSLVEIMVALTIGLFVTAGILQILVSTKHVNYAQDQVSQVQEKGRFATEFLNRYVRLAGYRSNTKKLNSITFQVDGANNFTRAGQIIRGLDDDPNHHKDYKFDSISFRYQGSDDQTIRDCLNRLVCSNEVAIISFYVDDKDGDGVLSLYCESQVIPLLPPTPAVCRVDQNLGTQNQPLIDGLEDMEIRYGINISNNRYATLDATAVNNQSLLWNRIVSVKFSLLLRTDDNVTADPQSYLYPPWSGSVTQAKDLRLRRVFTVTTNLRNRTP